MKLGKAVVKSRVVILIAALVLLIPSVLGMIYTRVNYDMLNYLPENLDTVKGQKYMLEDFHKGAFSFLIFENADEKTMREASEKIKEVDHVATVLNFSDIADGAIPEELLPDKIYDAVNAGDSSLMAVFFDSSSSSDETITAIAEIRKICDGQCLVSGISAMVTDLRDLCEREEAVYVAIAVVLAVAAMMLFMDNWIVPFVFLASIGMAILMNLGSNYFLGEISYITKALSAVLQLAVTMDYSIFLWSSYNEQKPKFSDNREAMAKAIHETVTSVLGSSITTVAGFIALCFMTFTLGRDLGIVMAKGVLIGVLGCVTILPSMILVLDKPLSDISKSLPKDMANVIANTKLKDEFGMSNTHMVLVDANLNEKEIREMNEEFKNTDGIKFTLGLDSVVGSMVPEEMLPDSVKSIFKSDRWQMMILSSEYTTASDEMNAQIQQLNKIIKAHDENGLLVGEAACTNDLINITSVDFATVNLISIIAIFVIIMIVEKSISLPVILVAVIELAIFINLGLPHYFGESLPFIAPICISTIQLGATVDYAILMTTRYKRERQLGNDKRTAVTTALETSIPSIVVSAMGLFAATVGVAIYSDVDMIGSLCALMARGAIISMFCVILILPAMFMLFDKLIGVTTIGFRAKKSK